MRKQLNAAVVGSVAGVPAANELCLASVELFGVDGAAVSVIYEGSSRGTFGSSSEASRRLDEYQFTFGEGPCLDAVATHEAVLVTDLDSSEERRWPAFAEAALDEGVRSVFALPIMISSVCVGALDLFRDTPGPLGKDELAGAAIAAQLASLTLLDLIANDASDSSPSSPNSDDVTSGDEDAFGLLADMDRIEVYQATGMLISQLDVGPAEALVRLRAHAIATNQTARQVAVAILERILMLERDDHDGINRSSR
ncbi:GAF and ANTAR domain-containing protein [Nocardioides sp.]|uniref:GAF and ANTAR domain-containing protein n=1 Tax=Nocardioides sp. TaxID=35761 RepID=UPI002C5DC6D7|nr:GAF and ANTAR domain-containing protein [Nocardioides sp.]HXH79272.1 GAF and ANTAR domain-containing protein [Nocardioides sp.]